MGNYFIKKMKFITGRYLSSSFIFILFTVNNILSQWTVDWHSHLYLNYISVVDSNIAWAVGADSILNNKIIRRNPSGVWETIPLNGIFDSHDLTCVAAKDNLNAWVTDGNGGSANGGAHIYRTTNGGLNWVVQISTGGGFGYFNGIKFSRVNPMCGYAWSDPPDSNGSPLKIYKTTDGGNIWNVYSVSVDPRFRGTHNSICVTDSAHAWFGLFNSSGFYDYQKILYTTNGGVNYSISSLPFQGYSVPAIEFKYDNQYGISATDDQYDYYCSTFNGGISWQYHYYQNIGNSIKIIWIPNTYTWYSATLMTAPNTRMYKTTDNGSSWIPMAFPDSLFIRLYYMDGVSYGNKAFLYAVEYWGKIFRLADNVEIIGIKSISNEVPKSFSLHQNYPNPFNPATIIKFEIPPEGVLGTNSKTQTSSKTEIRIYNALGRNVAVLVNEKLSPGIYEVEWDAANLPSGVYYYRIMSGVYSETRKMVLLK